jgi:predicted HAD superfamily Cof-like phosphohydrolase
VTIDKQVAEFHRLFGFPVRETPAIPERDEVQLRLRHIAEEFLELLEAHENVGNRHLLGVARSSIERFIRRVTIGTVDLVAAADALADIDYVVAGTRLTYGIPGDEVAKRVHASNLAKVGGPVVNGKQLKPEGWKPPDIAGALREAGWK